MEQKITAPSTQALPPIIENCPAVVFRLSHKGDNWRTLHVTQNISKYGYNAEDFLSGRKQWFTIVHPDDRVLVSKTVSDYEAHNINNFKLYYRIVTAAGESIHVTEYNTVNRDDDGNILCYDTYIFNNTQDDASRRLIDDHFRQQLVLNDILMSLHDADQDQALQIILDRTGEYLDTSRALLFKDSPDHKTCKIVYEWCNQDVDSVKVLDYSITYETGMPEIYIALQTTGSLIINHGQIPENCKEEFEAEGLVASAIFAIYLDGEHYGFVCFDDCVVERVWDEDTVRFLKNVANIISTVLARQSAAQKLAQNQKTYETVLNNVDSYIFVTSLDTNEIIFANRTFKDKFQPGQGTVDIGEYLNLCSAISSAPAQNNADKNAYPEIFCHVTGEWLAISTEIITWVNGEKVRLVNCYNITAKKHFANTLEQRIEERTHALRLMTEEAEKAKQRAEDAALAKSQFLANMSHEIRTPMNAILGLSELLAEDDLNPRQMEHIKAIRSSSNVLLTIINDILDISKLEAGRLSLVNVNYNLEQTLDYVSSLLKVMAKDKTLEYQFSASGSIDICLYGDDIRLRQVLLNLLGNAVKFTQRGSVRLDVNIGDETIVFSVTDTGVGINKEDTSIIFEPFSQSDTHKNRKIQGTGLGLPICKSLIELMGGTIEVTSTYGSGSVFAVTIPKVLGDAAQLIREPVLENSLYSPDTKVLVVDDIDINLYVAQAILEEFGIYTATAPSGAKAIELIKENDFDLVFMDHMMPEMNGIEATKIIRGMGEKYERLPIIALTANAVVEARDLFEKSGMSDFLSKPIEVNKLNMILEKWLPSQKRLHQPVA